ncbi:response regulator [Spirosoma sp. KCTC 42546]|uniref:response regulator n=1 Tax=Spirosoma sp. KCTC 42546 TaxID=2520506 RepID=UPI00115848CE|nr:response regulator [Spirosoma sp. KCTC 42546]QDK80900.1 response regulator [Spirosoma sp. KCTC 42546]
MPNQFPILLVDDDPNVAEILTKAAQSSFAEASFIHVSSFEEAKRYIEELEGKGPKIVLLDIDLQDKVDGLDFLTLLRAHPKGRILPVVVLSASKTAQLVERAYSYGASSFTVKPFSYSDWKTYLSNLKTYWFETVTLLDVRHSND